jgi:ppGpp synthetase/RelA/SpoT-type nucleotidyltranferase
MIFEDGGTLDSKIDKLEGKILYIFQLGIKEPMEAQIMKAQLDSPNFSKRGLKLSFRNGGEERIKAEDVKEFLAGKPIEMKDSKEPYLISLKKKYDLGGIVQRFSSAGVLQFSPSTVNEVGNFFEEGGEMADGGSSISKEFIWTFDVSFSHGKRNQPKVMGRHWVEVSSTTEKGALAKASKEIRRLYQGDIFSYIRPRLVSKQTFEESIESERKSREKFGFSDGGNVPVHIVDEGVSFDEDMYSGILSDFDMDGLPNADDPHPFNEEDNKSVEQMKFSKTFKSILETKQELNDDLNEFIGKLKTNAPSESKIYGRTKTPFSILNKLVSTRLLDEKKGLKDLVGTTVTFEDFEDLEDFKNKANKGLYGKVLDFDDYYVEPKDGYRAYHFIIEQNEVPIELQLKTNRMKDVNVLSHDAYKNRTLNKDYMLYLTTLADQADKGNKTAQNEFAQLMSKKSQVEKQLNN